VRENPSVPVTDAEVARVVAEVSAGADDPQHVSALVGAFMQRQPIVGHYVSAHAAELTLEGVVLTLLHASVVARCVELAAGRRLRAARPEELDAAARSPAVSASALAAEEPALIAYLDGNLAADDPTLGGARRAAALALLRVIARAFVDQA
jgi:hypothetical protein